jgi:hypothetical protein
VREEEIKESVENGGRKKAAYSVRQPDWNSTRGWTHYVLEVGTGESQISFAPLNTKILIVLLRKSRK